MTLFRKLSDNSLGTFYLLNHPENCPECHNKTTPNFLFHKLKKDLKTLFVFFNCPNVQCDNCYSAEYETANNSNIHFRFNSIVQGSIIEELFSEEIKNLSPSFIKIYNEAYFAEQNNLLEICGVGYRKALEFLIKDYIIKKNPDKEEPIKKILLGKCINEFVEDSRIKETAKRAVWLGNDHTHYVKKWESKDLSDLKLLIKLSVNWVESEIMTETLISSMAD